MQLTPHLNAAPVGANLRQQGIIGFLLVFGPLAPTGANGRASEIAAPQEAHFVDRVVKFREAVALEFERLVCEGGPKSDLPEVEMEELQASTEAVAFAAQ